MDLIKAQELQYYNSSISQVGLIRKKRVKQTNKKILKLTNKKRVKT